MENLVFLFRTFSLGALIGYFFSKLSGNDADEQVRRQLELGEMPGSTNSWAKKR